MTCFGCLRETESDDPIQWAIIHPLTFEEYPIHDGEAFCPSCKSAIRRTREIMAKAERGEA